MAYGASNGHVTDDVTWHQVLWGSTVSYPCDRLASCLKFCFASLWTPSYRPSVTSRVEYCNAVRWTSVTGSRNYIHWCLLSQLRLETAWVLIYFYRAMHFSAKRGIAIVCRLSVRLSLSARPSVTLVDCDHIGWNSWKIISPLVSMGCSLFATLTWRVCSKGNTPKFGLKVTHPMLIWASEIFDRKLRPNGYR